METKPWITSFSCVFENERKKIRSSSTTSVVWISWNKSNLQGEENLKAKKKSSKQTNKQARAHKPSREINFEAKKVISCVTIHTHTYTQNTDLEASC